MSHLAYYTYGGVYLYAKVTCCALVLILHMQFSLLHRQHYQQQQAFFYKQVNKKQQVSHFSLTSGDSVASRFIEL